jgi:hypothetical protein
MFELDAQLAKSMQIIQNLKNSGPKCCYHLIFLSVTSTRLWTQGQAATCVTHPVVIHLSVGPSCIHLLGHVVVFLHPQPGCILE